MAILNGLNATTHQNLQLDAGVFLMGLDESTLDTFDWGDIASKGLLGATKGGATFTATPELRNLLEDINGSRGAYKTGQVIDNWDVTLKTTISEVTANNLKLAMNLGSDIGEVKTHHTKYKASVGMIKGKQYNNDIVWAGKIAGKQKPIVILLKNVLNTNGVNFVAADKDSGGIEVELKAHFDLSKPNDVPFYIYLPNS